MKKVILYTDGACEGNPGPGGWAALLLWNGRRKEVSGGDPATTNNRMELLAAIAGLRILKEPCAVQCHTDSRYVRDGITRWILNWKRNGWKTRQKEPVKNGDLWQELDRLQGIHRVDWQWVKGHAGQPENERCDTLAREAVAKIKRSYSQQELRHLLAVFKATAETGDPDRANTLV